MKCVQRNKVTSDTTCPTIRVSDEKAAELVASGDWRYVAKKEWKATGRNYYLNPNWRR